jgi:hypothetical protein
VAFDPTFIKYSRFLNLLKDKGFMNPDVAADKDMRVTLEQFSESTVQDMTAFLQQYHERPFIPLSPPLRERGLEILLPSWCQAFLQSLSPARAMSLLKLADYLDIKVLTDTLCASVASQVLQNNVDEMREMFPI